MCVCVCVCMCVYIYIHTYIYLSIHPNLSAHRKPRARRGLVLYSLRQRQRQLALHLCSSIFIAIRNLKTRFYSQASRASWIGPLGGRAEDVHIPWKQNKQNKGITRFVCDWSSSLCESKTSKTKS